MLLLHDGPSSILTIHLQTSFKIFTGSGHNWFTRYTCPMDNGSFSLAQEAGTRSKIDEDISMLLVEPPSGSPLHQERSLRYPTSYSNSQLHSNAYHIAAKVDKCFFFNSKFVHNSCRRDRCIQNKAYSSYNNPYQGASVIDSCIIPAKSSGIWVLHFETW